MIIKFKKKSIRSIVLCVIALITILFGLNRILDQGLYQVLLLFFASIMIVLIFSLIGFLAGYIFNRYKKN